MTSCFCLLLLGLLVWQLARDGFNVGWLFGSPDFAKGAPELDSFSEPSVGLAIVKQRAMQFMTAYIQSRAQAELSQAGPLRDSTAAGIPAGPASISSLPAAVNRPAAPEVSALKPFEDLHAAVHNLDLDLDWKLMAVYSRNHWCNEFLSCYLRLVQQATECPASVGVWTLYALECARECGRTEEVSDMLHHLIRFHPDPRRIEGIRAALEQWEAQNLPGPQVSER